MFVSVIPEPSLVVVFLLILFIPLFTKYFAAFLANIDYYLALCFATSALALSAAVKVRPKRGKIPPNCTILDC